ncbi:MAG TPA: tetratricopeptide repeat protein [bacterium]|nr:tetratricopeptide repeat protein [bacterium]
MATPLSALGASARADGLGGAFVGLADDPSALFYNSAGLSQLRAVSLSINHNSYLAGSFEETLLFGLPVGPLGGFAAALQYVSWGGLDDRDANGVSLGTFTDGDAAFSVGWGMPVLKGLSLGLALHGTQQKIVDSLYSSLSGDAGLLWAPDSKLRVGLSYSGLGTALSGFAPAQDLHMGLSGLWDLGKGSGLRPLLAGDWEPRGVSRVQGGLEGVLEGNYFLRLGFQVPLADNQVGGLTGFTAGAGFNLGSVRLDYAFVPYGDLGTSHRLSLAYEFPTSAPAALRPVTVNANPVTVQAAPVTVVVTPGPTPLSANGSPKSKIEVRFELPGDGSSAQGQAPVSYQLAPYEKAAQDNPGDSRAWRNLGIVYLRAGQNALGVQCLEQALRLNPNDPALKKWLDEYHLKNPSKP